MNQQLKDIKLK